MRARLTSRLRNLHAILESQFLPITSRSTPRTIGVLFGLLLTFAPAFVALDVELGGVTPPDAMFGYSATQAYQAFDAEGAGGRQFHLIFELIDLFMIPVYALLYATTIAYTGRRLFSRGGRVVTWAIVVPLLAGLYDYAENAVIITLLLCYPEPLTALATAAGGLTVAKWTFVNAGASLALLGLLGIAGQAAVRWYQRRSQWSVDVRRSNLPKPPNPPVLRGQVISAPRA